MDGIGLQFAIFECAGAGPSRTAITVPHEPSRDLLEPPQLRESHEFRPGACNESVDVASASMAVMPLAYTDVPGKCG